MSTIVVEALAKRIGEVTAVVNWPFGTVSHFRPLFPSPPMQLTR